MVKLKDLKIGSKVKVAKLSYVSDIQGAYRCPVGGWETGVVSDMIELSNKVVTIADIKTLRQNNSTVIRIKEDKGMYAWTLAMFSEVVNENEYAVLDRDDSRLVEHIEKKNLPSFLRIKKVIRNGKATICFFEDRSDIFDIKTFKVVSRCVDGDIYSLARGIRVCCLKATVKVCQKQIDLI